MRPKSISVNRLPFCQVVLAIALTASATSAQTSSFSYQGRLADGGTPANGNYDLQFALWDSLSGGSQVGSTQTVNTVAVSSGVFTVSLDFGASSFNGANRFLEISARPSGGSFMLLSPRQQVTATPYAVRSVSAGTADSATNATNATTATNATQLGGVAASQYVQTNDSRLTDSRPPTGGSANYIQNTSGAQTADFNISGNGTAGGTLSGTVVNAAAQFNLSGVRAFSIIDSNNTLAGAGSGSSLIPGNSNNGVFNSFFGFNAGNVSTSGNANAFFGSRAGIANTTGSLNAFFGAGSGSANTEGGYNSFFGDQAGGVNTKGSENTLIGWGAGDFVDTDPLGSGNTLIGYATNATAGVNNSTAIGANAVVSQSNSMVLGSTGPNAVRVGIGITAPVFRLHVVDSGAAGLRVQTNTGGGAVASFGGFGDFQIDSNGVAGGRFIVQQGGNVGIGTITLAERLHVFGNVRVGTSGTNGCIQRFDGNAIAGTCSSDVRFKRDITPFPDLLNKLAQLRPVHYYWRSAEFPLKHFGTTQGYGLVAQEVEQVLPELVSEDAEGYKQVDYSKLPLLLLQAVKELKAENDQMKPQQQLIKQQQLEIARLNARLQTIGRALKTRSGKRRR